MREGYRKSSFEISKENYDYLIRITKKTGKKVGPSLNIILDEIRMQDIDTGIDIAKSIEEKEKILVSLSVANIEKLNRIASKYCIPRSAVLELFLNNLTGDESIKFEKKLNFEED